MFRPPTMENQCLIDEGQTAIGHQFGILGIPHNGFNYGPRTYPSMNFDILIKSNPFDNDVKLFTTENCQDDSMRDPEEARETIIETMSIPQKFKEVRSNADIYTFSAATKENHTTAESKEYRVGSAEDSVLEDLTPENKDKMCPQASGCDELMLLKEIKESIEVTKQYKLYRLMTSDRDFRTFPKGILKTKDKCRYSKNSNDGHKEKASAYKS